MIVEDDPVFRRVMSIVVSRNGLTAVTASDGQIAFERICQGGIDFLVTDHQMPICTGLDLLERLKNETSMVRPPTILCTAKGLELDGPALTARYQLAAIMHKPFSPRKLSEVILQHLRKPLAPRRSGFRGSRMAGAATS
jgi:CheY-like chemotaxis protein